MRTDDFMYYYADIFVESVQYGNRTELCYLMTANDASNDYEVFLGVTNFGKTVAGVEPQSYDWRELAKT